VCILACCKNLTVASAHRSPSRFSMLCSPLAAARWPIGGRAFCPSPRWHFLAANSEPNFWSILGPPQKNPTDLHLLWNFLIYSLRPNAVRSVVGSLCKAFPGLDAWQSNCEWCTIACKIGFLLKAIPSTSIMICPKISWTLNVALEPKPNYE